MDILTLKKSLCCVSQCDDSGLLILKEKSSDSTLKLINICDVPCGSLIIKMDNIRFEKFFLNNKEWGFNKHSDYLIVTDDKLVFIEMKSQKQVNGNLIDECIQKFTSDVCVIQYADEIIKLMLTKNPFFEVREMHFVLLYQNPSIQKSTTVMGVEAPNKTPCTFRKIPIANEGTVSFYRTI